MRRQYSFNEISRITMGAPESENKPTSQPYFTSSKPRQSWTDMRVEQIKKKYDTPSHRKNYSNFGNNQRSKENQVQMPSNNPYSSYRSPLRDSLASGNVVRKDRTTSGNSGYKQTTQYKANLQQSTQNVPRFSYDTKQNGSFMEKFSQIKNSMKPQPKLTYSKQIPLKARQVSRDISNSTNANASSKIDPRVQNIDKINMKIKKILDCLNQNQKMPRVERTQQKQEMKSSFMRGSIMSKENQSEELQQTKILSRQKIGYDREQSKTNLKRSITNTDKYALNSSSTYQKMDNTRLETKFESKYDYNRLSSGTNATNLNWKMDDNKYGYLRTEESTDFGNIKNNGSSTNNFQLNSTGKNQINNKIEDNDSWFEPSQTGLAKNRSRSCLNNFKEGDIKLNSGKKLDDEISKINVRIRQFQQEKKKLNIDFKPYNCELRYNRSSSNLADHKTQRSLKPPLPRQVTKPSEMSSSSSYILPSRSSFPEKMKTQASSSQYLITRSTFQSKKESYQFQNRYTFDTNKNFKPTQEYNGRALNRNSSSIDIVNSVPMFGNRDAQQNKKYEARDRIEKDNTNTPEFEEKMQSVSEQQIRRQRQREREKEKQKEREREQEEAKKVSNELKLKTQQGIEERKRKLLETATVSFSRETKRLISNLFEQVKLDEDLRNAKIWLRDLLAADKWDQLQKEASLIGVDFDKAEFQVTEQEDNPFYSVRESQENFNCLLNRWMKAQNYWKQNILGQFNLKQFEVEKFTEDKVDLQRKGYFVVEDLVRFLNMQTGTFYRNRDLVLVFRRLTSSQKLSWPQFLSKLDQQQNY